MNYQTKENEEDKNYSILFKLGFAIIIMVITLGGLSLFTYLFLLALGGFN